MVEAATRAIELHLYAKELSNILEARREAARVPIFLRRNLSYVEPGRQALLQGNGKVLKLQLHASGAGTQAGAGAAGNGQAPVAGEQPAAGASLVSSGKGGSSTPKDVLIAALCVTLQPNGSEAFVPIAACAVPVPAQLGAAASIVMQLPLFGVPLSAGLSVVLIHKRSEPLATLVSLGCRRRKRVNGGVGANSSGRTAGNDKVAASCCRGFKALTPAVTSVAAFQLLSSGSEVAYSVLQLQGLQESCSGKGSGGVAGREGGGMRQGLLTKLDGTLTTHVPPAATNGMVAAAGIPVPWIQLQPRLHRGMSGSWGGDSNPGGTMTTGSSASNGNSGSSSSRVQFRYSLSVARNDANASSGSSKCDIAGQDQAQHQLRALVGDAALGADERKGCGTKRKASIMSDEQQPVSYGKPQSEPAPLHVPPLAGQQQEQQEQQQADPLLTYMFTSLDGSRIVGRQLQRGFRCPMSSCHSLRCHSYAALQQHLRATHSYLTCYFCEAVQGMGIEVYLRCKPAWSDPRGDFLPRQLNPGALQAHPLGRLLRCDVTVPARRKFCFHCPQRQRHLRLGPSGGFHPVIEEIEDEEALELQAEKEVAPHIACLAAVQAPSCSAPFTSSQVPSANNAEAGGQAALMQRVAGSNAAAAVAAAAAARRRKVGGRGGVRTAGRGRESAVPVRHEGLAGQLLTRGGRPRFYHSRTCVAMTRQELLGKVSGRGEESEGDLLEWQRECEEQLAEQAELCSEERHFMSEWNLFVHRQPIHADADLPAALQQFAAQNGEQLQQDGPFRRCLLAYLRNLWQFRLLKPQQLYEVTRNLPQLV